VPPRSAEAGLQVWGCGGQHTAYRMPPGLDPRVRAGLDRERLCIEGSLEQLVIDDGVVGIHHMPIVVGVDRVVWHGETPVAPCSCLRCTAGDTPPCQPRGHRVGRPWHGRAQTPLTSADL
jgi:hypothetical protein